MTNKGMDDDKKRKGRAGHTVSALIKVENVSDGDHYGSEKTLVVALELALIKDLYLYLGRFLDGSGEGG